MPPLRGVLMLRLLHDAASRPEDIAVARRLGKDNRSGTLEDEILRLQGVKHPLARTLRNMGIGAGIGGLGAGVVGKITNLPVKELGSWAGLGATYGGLLGWFVSEALAGRRTNRVISAWWELPETVKSLESSPGVYTEAE